MTQALLTATKRKNGKKKKSVLTERNLQSVGGE